LEIHFIDKISSTHTWLCEAVKNGDVRTPFALYAGVQTDGVGSRGNSWNGGEGNLFLSFALPSSELPDDLPHPSVSIYFSWLLLEFLRERGSSVWLKWPNDFYLNDKKLGGTITAKIKDFFVISVGINLSIAKDGYSTLDILLSPHNLVRDFIPSLKNLPLWKHIFSNYKIEFYLSQKFHAHIDDKSVSLAQAVLCPDGSIEIENKKVYSLR
jgi:BirA family biotin operon repressor/biotin-[acetyl-CoA-carboxylase] ligase